MTENDFFPAILRFMDASPKEFISELNKVFLTVWQLDVPNALAAYQTINTLMLLRGRDLDESSIKVITELRDNAILGRLKMLASCFRNFSEKDGIITAIESVTGKSMRSWS